MPSPYRPGAERPMVTGVDVLREEVSARLAVHEQVLQSIIADVESITEVINAMLDDDSEPMADYPEEEEIEEPGATELREEESPAEEAQRLRREARAVFEADTEPEAPRDMNDVVGIPEDGNAV